MVSAAPMGGNWFHQHFGVSREPLRLTGWFGPVAPWSLFQDLALQLGGPPTNRFQSSGTLVEEKRQTGEELIDFTGIDLKDGGSAIPYQEEDPFIRQEFEATLRCERIASRMDESLYR